MPKWYNSKIIQIKDLSPTTRHFELEVEEVDRLDFKAGQFVVMDLPIHEKRIQRWRSYSIANAPEGRNVLEFCIVKSGNGLGTKYLFEEVEEGSIIRFKEPYGLFVLPEKVENDLVFLCTGTGIAPFRSMIWDLYLNKKPHKNIHLIFGTRYKEGILYREEFEQLQEKMKGFQYSVALSREENINPDDFNFDIHKGYIHPVYSGAYKEKRNDLDFYICGWQNMLDDTVKILAKKLGYDMKQIHYESYG